MLVENIYSIRRRWQAGTVQLPCHLYCGIKIVLIGDRKSVAVPCSAMLFLVIMRVL
jgi:hypothetical protein